MLQKQRNRSSQRYPKDKILPKSLPKGRSYNTFYSKGKEERREATDENRLTLLKEFIDNYFEEEAKPYSTRMPLIKRRASQLMDSDRMDDRRKRSTPKPEEDLSKSVSCEGASAAEPFLPMATSLRWSVSAMEQLPSIHEQAEGHDEKQEMAVLNQTSHLSFLKKTSSLYSDINPEGEGEQRRLTFENQLFCVFVVLKEGKPVGRVKEFKQRGLPFMQRESRMKNYGIASLWRNSRYNHRSFSISLRPPIKDQLMSIMPDEVNPAQLKIKQKALHTRLLANNCQQLSLLLRNFCIQLKKVEGRVLNNKINPANLFLRPAGLQIAEWGYASFREQFTIRQGKFQKRRYGVLRGDDWFVSPEYLAPEIVRQLIGEQTQLWGQKGSSDVWSLGLSFFQMITLIPVWVTAKCALVHRPAIVRSGVLAAPGRELLLLLKKQAGVQKTIRRLLSTETMESQQNDKLFNTISRMVQPDLKKRISLDQIIACLS